MHRSKIILIDDDAMVRSSVQLSLELGNYHNVHTFENAHDARSELESAQLLLLDINLIGKSGIDLLPEMVREFPKLAVIMLTGEQGAKTAVWCMKNGAFDYLVKPVTDAELLQAVQEALKITADLEDDCEASVGSSVLVLIRNFSPSHLHSPYAKDAPIVAYLCAHYQNPELSLQRMARDLETNTTYLSRDIVRIWAMPFRQLLNHIRLASFCQIASTQNENYSIEAIAGMVGYHRKATFYSACHAVLGMTPQDCVNTVLEKRLTLKDNISEPYFKRG